MGILMNKAISSFRPITHTLLQTSRGSFRQFSIGPASPLGARLANSWIAPKSVKAKRTFESIENLSNKRTYVGYLASAIVAAIVSYIASWFFSTTKGSSLFPTAEAKEAENATQALANPYMKDVQQYFVMREIGTLQEVLKAAPFNAEERKAIETHTAVIKNLEENQTLLTTIFLDALTSLPGDVSAHIKNLHPQLLLSGGSRELKEQLHELTNVALLKVLALKDTEIPRDTHMAARITLIITLEAFREYFEFNTQKTTEQWNALLSVFQEECHSSSSSLINDLLKKMGPSFFQQPFTALLWNQGLNDDVFYALNQIRKDQFKQAGFDLA